VYTTDNALDPAYFDWGAHLGATVTCAGDDQICPDDDSATLTDESCIYKQKLCVQCENNYDTIMIYVRSNNLPNHCFRAFSENVSGETDDDNNWAGQYDIDFRVEWNRDVQDIIVVEESEIDDDTGSLVTDLLCDVNAAAKSRLPSGSSYTNYATENPSFVGLGTNGVMFEYPFLFSERWQSQNYLDIDSALWVNYAEDFVYNWYDKMD